MDLDRASTERPHVGWGLLLQGALLGLLAYWLVVPLVRTLIYALAAGLAWMPPLRPVAAVLELLARMVALLLTFVVAVIAVPRLNASPLQVGRALGYLAANSRSVLLLASLGLMALQFGLTYVEALMLGQLNMLLFDPNEPAALPSTVLIRAYGLMGAALPALVLLLAVWAHRRLEATRRPSS